MGLTNKYKCGRILIKECTAAQSTLFLYPRKGVSKYMLYEILKIIVLVFGPLVIYTAIRTIAEAPELVTALPTTAHRVIEVVGAIFMFGACFVAYVGPLSGGMALIGLILLATPLAARKLSQHQAAYFKA
jgi:hypothetical protein